MFPVSLGIKQKHVIKAKFQHLSFKTQAYLVDHEPTVRPKCIYLGAHTWTLQSLFTYGWLPRPSRTPACNWFFQIWPTLHPRRLMSGPPVDCSPKLKSKENFLFIYFILFFFFLPQMVLVCSHSDPVEARILSRELSRGAQGVLFSMGPAAEQRLSHLGLQLIQSKVFIGSVGVALG